MAPQGSFTNIKDSDPNSPLKPKRKKIVSRANSAKRGASGNIADEDLHCNSEKSTFRRLNSKVDNEEKDKLIIKHPTQKHFHHFLRANSRKKNAQFEKLK
jgi:hypothetical protein